MQTEELSQFIDRTLEQTQIIKAATPVHFVPGIVTEVSELRKPCAKVKKVREGLQLASELLAVLNRNNKRAMQEYRKWDRKSHKTMTTVPGVGLSANQIGIQKQVCVIDNGVESFALVNPRITQWSETLFEFEEGCLSLPGVRAFTHRYAWVQIECSNWSAPRMFGCAPDATNRIDTLLNVCFQHEIGHLFGKLCVDFEQESYPAPTEWESWRP